MKNWIGILVLLCLFFPVSAPAKEKVILDSDMVEGFDDGVAMLALAAAPNVELVGVTLVAGNTWVPEGMAYALRQLELANLTVPVMAGSDTQLRTQRQSLLPIERRQFGVAPDAWIGAFSRARPDSWKAVYRERYGKEPQLRPDSRHAVEFIIDTVRKHPGEITFMAIGPCSNLAQAVLKAPDIVPLIRRVVYMGGAFFTPGNVSPTAEFNWWFDPEAARIAVRTPFREQIMVGLDVCEKYPFDLKRYQHFLQSRSKTVQGLLQATYLGRAFAENPAYTQYIWDVVAAAIVIDPTLVTEERTCTVDVEAAFGASYGRALVYPENADRGGREARIILQIDEKRFWEMLERL